MGKLMLDQEFITKHFTKIQIALVFGIVMFFVGILMSNNYITNGAVIFDVIVWFGTLAIINKQIFMDALIRLESFKSKKNHQ